MYDPISEIFFVVLFLSYITETTGNKKNSNTFGIPSACSSYTCFIYFKHSMKDTTYLNKRKNPIKLNLLSFLLNFVSGRLTWTRTDGYCRLFWID